MIPYLCDHIVYTVIQHPMLLQSLMKRQTSGVDIHPALQLYADDLGASKEDPHIFGEHWYL